MGKTPVHHDLLNHQNIHAYTPTNYSLAKKDTKMGSLKLFVKAVRKAKTIADERTVVRKESAAIRTSFRDPNLDQTTRRINISKLLYLYIMGEKTHFGQVECLKLLASPRFADKRLGYLATMLLLDENQEVLTLLTNSLDNDMQHPNTFIVGLALTCLGNIASPELARDLYTNVEKIMTGTNSVFLKKKTCLVAAKLVEKDPDLAEVFMPKINVLLTDKTPLVLLGTCRIILAIYDNCPDERVALIKFLPKLISHLKRVISSGYMPDYDVNGITDPFLQVTLLSVMRSLATDTNCSPEYLEAMNDILTQVALNLDSGKNAAHAILYECIKTIFAITSDQSLRVLGVNLLGKFLLTKDNNTRYVALEMLLTVINFEPLAVQRHRSTIVSCLSDGDISIRRRALELVFAILNEQNIRVLIREILTFLENCTDAELKPYITSQLVNASSKYAPGEKWHFDTLVRMLKVSGNYITPDIVSNILALVMRSTDGELKKHVVGKLLLSSLEDPSEYGLALVTVWCLGEYADLILNTAIEVNGKSENVTDAIILTLLENLINNSNYSEAETVQLVTFILTAVIKLSVKLTNPQSIETLRLILNSRSYDDNLEIQTRAVEYQQIFGQDERLKHGLLARMPAPPAKERQALSLQNDSKKQQHKAPVAASNASADLLNLLDDDAPGLVQQVSLPQQTSNDLLSDIFGSQPTPTAPASAGLVDVFNGQSAAAAAENAIEAFANGHLRIAFSPASFLGGQAVINADITSMAPQNNIEHVQLLIAVPKTQKLTMSTTSGSDSLVGGNAIKQVLKISGKEGSKVKLRVKVKYNLDGVTTEDQFDFAGFTHTL